MCAAKPEKCSSGSVKKTRQFQTSLVFLAIITSCVLPSHVGVENDQYGLPCVPKQ